VGRTEDPSTGLLSSCIKREALEEDKTGQELLPIPGEKRFDKVGVVCKNTS
jgi:hypothetical protein